MIELINELKKFTKVVLKSNAKRIIKNKKMTYTEYKSIKAKYNKILDELTDKLNSFPKYPDGRITDEVQKKT